MALVLGLSALSCKTAGSDSSLLAEAQAGSWTEAASERNAEARCALGSVSGIQCKGDYCSQISLQCKGDVAGNMESWTSIAASTANEAQGIGNTTICPDGSLASGLKCEGKNCEKLALKCATFAHLEPKSCYWTGPFSEEYTGTFEFPGNARLQGLRCSDKHCDNLSAKLCRVSAEQQLVNEDVAAKYAPRVWLHKDEKFFPSSVEFFLNQVTIGDKFMVTKEKLNKATATNPAVFRGQNPATTPVPTYAEIVERGRKGNQEVVDIIYWFFYPYNRGKEFFNTMWGNHVGDWENLRVQFVDGKPQKVFIEAHGKAKEHEFYSMKFVDGTHPIVYAARGSHGIYTTAGNHRYKKFPKLVDVTGEGTAWDTWKSLVTFRYKTMGEYEGSLSWLNYKQRWGNPKSGTCAAGQCMLENGPIGPLAKNFGKAGFYKASDEQEYVEWDAGGILAYSDANASGEIACAFPTNAKRSFPLKGADEESFGCANDHIKSALLVGMKAGQKVTFYEHVDENAGSKAVLTIKEDISTETPVAIRSFNAPLSTAQYTLELHGSARLDGKISRIAILVP